MIKQKNNKKADVQMVSYVVLIVISLSLSVLVYSFLKSKPCMFGCKDKCPEDVFITIEGAVCSNQKLNLTISNRGLFNISLIYVRLGNETRQTPFQINKDLTSLSSPLSPGEGLTKSFPISIDLWSIGKNYIEVQPALLSEKRTIMLCNSRPRQEIVCD